MARGTPYRLISDEHMKAANTARAARRESSMGALRAELKKLGYSERDLRLQGFEFRLNVRVLKPGKPSKLVSARQNAA